MIRLKWPVICALLCSSYGYSESKWIRMQSPNFEAYSSAGERDTRETLRYFERVRDFFLQMDQREPQKPVPVHVIVFGSEKEYAPYRPNEFATAYYFGGADRDYIVMGRPGEQIAQLAVHEYVHLVARHGGLTLPPWLNEGIAELYSTLRMQGDKVVVGDLIPGRLQALSREKWVPLSVIVSAGPDSPYYNEKNKAGSLYNEGWALVHMLELSPDYLSRFSQFIQTVESGVESVPALEKTYGKPVANIEKDLQEYIRGNQFYGRLVPAKLANSKENFPTTPAPMFDVRLALADLADRSGKQADTRKTFEDLSREDPKRPEPWAGLGYLEWSQGRTVEAVEALGKAYELGNHSPKLLWDYGRLAEREHPELAVKALTDLQQLESQRVDVRMELAALHLSARRPGNAFSVLAGVSSVTVEDAPRFFRLLANAQIQMNDRAGARVTVAKLAANVKTPQDRTLVEEMQRYLERADSKPPPVIARSTVDEAPLFTNPGFAGERKTLLAPLPEIEGTFAEFVCMEKGFKIVVDTARGKKGFLLPDAKQVVIVGRAEGKVDLSCGPQTPVHVKLEYGPSPAGTDADGVVRVLYFDP